LLLRPCRSEREHDRLAPVCLDHAHRFLDPALLVRADREPEMARLDRLLVLRQDDPPAGHRHALHARKNIHERILALSGSKIGREPTTSTVTGKGSAMYSTA